MKLTKHTRALITLLFLGVLSCKKEVKDNIKPVISSIAISSTPATGTTVNIIASVSDDISLGTYKITIVDDFGFDADSIEDTKRFTYTYVGEIEDETSFNISIPLTIDANIAAGPYILNMSLIDRKGNQAESKILDFEIINSADQPTLSISNPVQNSNYNINDSIVLTGIITDDKAIQSIEFNTTTPNGLYDTQLFQFDIVVIDTWNIQADGDVKIYLPSTIGDYELETEVRDTSGNMKRETINFLVN